MPASRSRTERWRDSLQQIQDRNGGIEFTIARPGIDPEANHGDLLWRVRIVRMDDNELVVEAPTAMGNAIHLNPDIEIVGVIAVGQNKWMFRSTTLGMTATPGPRGLMMPAVRLRMPQDVERCQRRQHLRVSTAEIRLPEVECYPLLDPASAAPAEVACRDAIQRGIPQGSDLLPEVGPMFKAKLVNIGGGGVGVLVPKGESSSFGRSGLIWTRFDLRPEIVAPLGVTARVAHTHLTHDQETYAGISFEFAFHGAYRPFVADLLVRYLQVLQERQMSARKAA
ncbi:MAG: hypothetical protein U0573_15755 [Phycisphaerales bacterium]|nr:hypothetical protein [Planctomycetota bacterium]